VVNATPSRFTLGNEPVPIVQEAGWAPGLVWTVAENLAPTGIRSPDRPARSSVAIPTELSRPTETKLYFTKKVMFKLSIGSKKCLGPYKDHFLPIPGAWFLQSRIQS
jgi:hypothetical protein